MLSDTKLKNNIENIIEEVIVTNTNMKTISDKEELARILLE